MIRESFPPAGVVILYRPQVDVVENIRSYLDDVGLLVIVDNSPVALPEILELSRSSGKIVYHGGRVNRGIAAALNIGAEEAMSRGYEWLLTMDQDSRFGAGAVATLAEAAKRHPRLGIVSPRHALHGKRYEAEPAVEREPLAVMTSGNLLNLAAYRQAGPFLEKLFVDYVDYEYCLRLRRNGYRILVVPGAALFHVLGSTVSRRFMGLTFHPTNHAPQRRYYIMRNRLYVWKHYPEFRKADGWAFAKEIVKTVLFEDQRWRKLALSIRGVADFLRGRYGPLRN